MSSRDRDENSRTLLQVTDLCAAYDDTPVLTGIDLRVHEGETVAVLGPNGHGKTTALRAITGLHTKKTGSIVFNDDDISHEAPHRILGRGLVHVPQGDLLFGDMTVLENLLVGAYRTSAWRVRKERLDRVWKIFPRIYERQGELTRNLSGGERRMVAIGRGLMADVELIMIDEPSLGLAPIVIDNLYSALAELKLSGLTTLIVEESPERVSGIADAVYLLDGGVIAFEGKAEELIRDRAMLRAYLG
jgi:branched-chain amino acid transport system ATP-binding protein